MGREPAVCPEVEFSVGHPRIEVARRQFRRGRVLRGDGLRQVGRRQCQSQRHLRCPRLCQQDFRKSFNGLLRRLGRRESHQGGRRGVSSAARVRSARTCRGRQGRQPDDGPAQQPSGATPQGARGASRAAGGRIAARRGDGGSPGSFSGSHFLNFRLLGRRVRVASHLMRTTCIRPSSGPDRAATAGGSPLSGAPTAGLGISLPASSSEARAGGTSPAGTGGGVG